MSANKYLGIIFDLDGVLCSTDEYHYEAWKAIAEEIDINNFTPKDNNRQRGVSRMESLEILLEKSERKFTDKEKLILADKKNQRYKELLNNINSFDLSDEVRVALNTLRKAGIKLAIGSSSKNAGLILERLGLGNFFDVVVDGNSITKSKPNPEVFLKAAQMIGLQPSQCLVVEDAISGIEAGTAGGFDTAGIGGVMSYPKTTYPLRDFSQIMNIVFAN
ncbi:beta-phosphoglucomutase [Alkalibaculum sp. M08DMB]|uniref:Beta-phosphoglucomutase n=1 Tax=Alkalibaculum sporogenes TaxID=2655001 RepID=A0A6A7KBD5_9FIRM|nr:beta-phosphoglucomutase [Alkalibaculum sporogenes]MPW26581.1 beta-phosphoglucomutase [Alkalibaculum sporogenes]